MTSTSARNEAAPSGGRAGKQRNLFIHIPNDKKDALKALAVNSGMSLEAYVSAILCEAVQNKDEFVFVKKPTLAS